MNKQEVIDKLKATIPKNNIDDYQRGEIAGLNFALLLLAELDKSEKPIVPQYVADWYEEHKDNFEYSVQCLCVQGYKPLRQIDIWFNKTKNKPIETLAMMYKFGYEVEKEKLYTVEIPSPNEVNGEHIVLVKKESGVCIDCYYSDYYKKLNRAQLTEAEIKEDFEWAWKYAEEI